MRSTRGKTERPYAPLLYPHNANEILMCRIGGSLLFAYFLIAIFLSGFSEIPPFEFSIAYHSP